MMSKTDNQCAPICMAEEFWANSMLSIARHAGGVRFRGHEYLVVNDRGMDLWECTEEAIRTGRDKAIPAGEPADLLRKDFQPLYKKLGRDRFINILEQNTTEDETRIKILMKLAVKASERTPPQRSKSSNNVKQTELFND